MYMNDLSLSLCHARTTHFGLSVRCESQHAILHPGKQASNCVCSQTTSIIAPHKAFLEPPYGHVTSPLYKLRGAESIANSYMENVIQLRSWNS